MMNHIHFLTDLELTAEEQGRCLKGYIIRTATANCRDSGRVPAMEIARIEKHMQDRSIFHLIPVDDAAVLERRAMASPEKRSSNG